MSQFEPLWWCRGGHRMTVLGWGRPRRFPSLPPGERRFFPVGRDTYVLADCHWQADRAAHPVLVVLHGLEGSSHSHYVRGIADKAWRQGFNVVRLNQRNCGGTEHLTPGLYHSGLTADARAVVEELIERDGVQAIAVAGYSLGGNLALKLAGEYGPDAPRELACVAAVSPPIDLTQATVLLERRANLLYQWNFLWSLKRRIHRKQAVFPGLYSTRGLRRIRTVRAFDDAYTAPRNGFRDAADYYARAGAINVTARITVPALIVSALDDPFVPAAPFHDPRVAGNPNIEVVLTPHGGHCGFVCRPCADHDGYWAEWRVVQFVQAVMQAVMHARRIAEGAQDERKVG